MDAFMTIFGLYCLDLFFHYRYLIIDWDNHVAIGLLLLYITIIGTIFEIYDLPKASQLDTTFRNIVITAGVTCVLYFFTPILTPFLPEKRLQIIYFFMTIVFFMFVGRIAYVTLIASPRFYKNVLLVGQVNFLEQIADSLSKSDPNYKIAGYVNCEYSPISSSKLKDLYHNTSGSLLEIIETKNISEIIIASYDSEKISNEIYKDLMTLLERGFPIREYTQVYEEITRRVPVMYIGKDFYKYFPFSRSNKNTLYLVLLRLFDIVFSVLGLLIGILILPLVLLGNYCGNRGPLFYRQDRIGKHGEVFNIIKLRSMTIDAESQGAKWAQLDDVRITKFGKFLRRSRLDEVPQFINVLKNEMSIIGPRPERPIFVNQLSESIPFYETRHIVKPGLTGWAQVNTRYGSSVDDSLKKLEYDLYFIKHRSIFLDLNIIVKTISTIVYYRGQ